MNQAITLILQGRVDVQFFWRPYFFPTVLDKGLQEINLVNLFIHYSYGFEDKIVWPIVNVRNSR